MRRTRSAIGLDIGARRVKAAQVSVRAGSARVVACASFDRAEPDEPVSAREMERLAGVLDRMGFEGSECCVAVERDALLTSELELPPEGSGAPREQIARMELARAHKRDSGGFEMGLWEIPAPARSGPGSCALATACPHERAEVLLDAAESAGLAVTALDHPGCALARLVNAVDARSRVVLDLGWGASVLVLVRAGVVLYERAIEGGAIRSLHARIAEQTGLSGAVVEVLMSEGLSSAPGVPGRGRQLADRTARCAHDFAETVGRELKLSIDYLARRFPPAAGESPALEHIDLAGGGASLAGVVERLSERSGLALRPLRPADLLGAEESVLSAASSPALCVAAGLALRTEEADA